jgi:hypothetical protein
MQCPSPSAAKSSLDLREETENHHRVGFRPRTARSKMMMSGVSDARNACALRRLPCFNHFLTVPPKDNQSNFCGSMIFTHSRSSRRKEIEIGRQQ